MKNLNQSVGQFRVTKGDMASSPDDGNFGQFFIPINDKTILCIIAADAPKDELPTVHEGWEHVSVHARDRHVKQGRQGYRMRTPSWEEMAHVKSLFFEDDELVIQFHPAKADHINIHDHVLHLWRSSIKEIPMPPAHLV